MKNPFSQIVRKKVEALMNARGIKKTKLGEILSTGRGAESNQQKYLRATRFFESTADVGIDKLLKLVEFFEKPLGYFLDSKTSLRLTSSDIHSPTASKPLEEIEKSLRQMDLDENFIQNQLHQLKAMEAYNAEKDAK